MGRFAAALPRMLREGFTETMSILRNRNFQDLLYNYPRKKRTFVIAYETEDTVTSEFRRLRAADGHDYKPADYLAEFSRFVRENPSHIEAISILLDRPKDWSTDALSDLQKKLAETPQRFTVKHLQAAHKLRYDKALADIISMVKHAADEASPLLSAEERVNLAFKRVTAGREFHSHQQPWLERIRAHLVETLSIDEEDFDLFPIFERAGGWGRAVTVFAGRLPELIHQFNEAIAA